jgi:hypothetical protein
VFQSNKSAVVIAASVELAREISKKTGILVEEMDILTRPWQIRATKAPRSFLFCPPMDPILAEEAKIWARRYGSEMRIVGLEE